jgi:hypothetical protein
VELHACRLAEATNEPEEPPDAILAQQCPPLICSLILAGRAGIGRESALPAPLENT